MFLQAVMQNCYLLFNMSDNKPIIITLKKKSCKQSTWQYIQKINEVIEPEN